MTGQCREPWSRLDTSEKAFRRRWRGADPGCESEKSGEVILRRKIPIGQGENFLLPSFYAEGEVGVFL